MPIIGEAERALVGRLTAIGHFEVQQAVNRYLLAKLDGEPARAEPAAPAWTPKVGDRVRHKRSGAVCKVEAVVLGIEGCVVSLDGVAMQHTPSISELEPAPGDAEPTDAGLLDWLEANRWGVQPAAAGDGWNAWRGDSVRFGDTVRDAIRNAMESTP